MSDSNIGQNISNVLHTETSFVFLHNPEQRRSSISRWRTLQNVLSESPLAARFFLSLKERAAVDLSFGLEERQALLIRR